MFLFTQCFGSALDQLKDVPSYMTRELLLIQSSLNTTDAKDVAATIARAKKEKLRCSVVSSLERGVHIQKVGVGDERDVQCMYRQVTFQGVDVSSRHTSTKSILGFDSTGYTFRSYGISGNEFSAFKSLCACHHEFSREGFYCPKCQTKVCNLPTNCPVCGLRLVSSSHLARSYHHLFPVEPFIEDTKDNLAASCCV